jgi:4-aminobutyrate aminotransferase-like enzyme
VVLHHLQQDLDGLAAVVPFVLRLVQQVQARALRKGLILELGGRNDRVVRMLPRST